MKKLSILFLTLAMTLSISACGGNDAELAAMQAQLDALTQQIANDGISEEQKALMAENEALKQEVAALQAEVAGLKQQILYSGTQGLLLQCGEKIAAMGTPVQFAKAYEYHCKQFTDSNGKSIPVDVLLMLSKDNAGYIYDNNSGKLIFNATLPDPKTSGTGFIFEDIHDVYAYLRDFEVTILINGSIWSDGEMLKQIDEADIDAVNAALN